MAVDFLLIRHGEHVEFDRRLSGRRPGIALSQTGRAQAAALGASLAGERIDRIECSPLERTCETAEAIGAATGAPVSTSEPLIELNLGEWAGRGIDGLHDDPAWRAWNEQRATARIPGGESMGEAQGRIVSHLTSVAAADDGLTVALVTHSDMIRAAICWALALSLDNLHRFDIGPASVSRMVVGDWGARVTSVNERVARHG